MAFDDGYIYALERAKSELGRLQKQRKRLSEELARVERRIAFLTSGIEALNRLADQETIAEPPIYSVQPLAEYNSFTDAVAYLLKTSPQSRFVPTQVRDRLAELGYDLDRYKSDPVASIHTILKRLVKSGRVQTERNGMGKLTYRWISKDDEQTSSAAALIPSVE